MELNDAVKSRIEEYVKGNKVVLFMKGTRQQPMCGFSAKTIAALDSVLPDYEVVNVLDDPEIREGIKVYGNWPTIPQLYIDGELMGGCDIVLNMLNTGELHQTLGMEAPDRSPPEITVTDLAAEKIREVTESQPGVGLFFNVDSDFKAGFDLGQPQGHEIVSESNGLKIHMDIATAQRARGAKIDWVSNVRGEGLTIDIPGAPEPVAQMSVRELAERMAAGTITVVDIRSEAERTLASIEGSLPLDRELMAKLEAMPKDTGLAFLCHHGNASQGAAEYFRKKGFTDVSNVAGGINAWSLEVDENVPTY